MYSNYGSDAGINVIITISVIIGIIYLLSTAIFTSWLASKKGYSSGAWFALGLFFGFIAFFSIGFAPTQKRIVPMEFDVT